MSITTKVASSNSIHDEVYLIQQYVIKFVSDLWHGVSGTYSVTHVCNSEMKQLGPLFFAMLWDIDLICGTCMWVYNDKLQIKCMFRSGPMIFGRVMALGLWNLAKYLVVTTLFHLISFFGDCSFGLVFNATFNNISSRIEDYSNSTCRNNFECALHLKYMFLMIILLKLNINLRQGKDTYVEDTW